MCAIIAAYVAQGVESVKKTCHVKEVNLAQVTTPCSSALYILDLGRGQFCKCGGADVIVARMTVSLGIVDLTADQVVLACMLLFLFYVYSLECTAQQCQQYNR